MDEARAAGLQAFRELMPGVLPDDVTSFRDGRFADELTDLTLDHVFGVLWNRPGLDRRSRSLVTLGILIALRASEEMRFHFRIALQNGVTPEELEEVVYHSTAYAGYPAAVNAMTVGREVVPMPGDTP